ncbi:DUF177 domain-containing protein, partial [bacterium]
VKREDFLDLNDALQHPGRRIAVDVSTEMPEEPDVDLVAPLEGFLEAVSTGNALLITGEFQTRAVMECARCAAPIETDVSFIIDEQFNVKGIASSLSQQDYARVVDDEPFPLFEENNLMVEALLRQGLLLAMPDQPLCSGSWDVPCPVAPGSEAEVKAPEEIRPEFASLQNLLKPEGDV